MTNDERELFYKKQLKRFSNPNYLYRYRAGDKENAKTHKLYDIEALNSKKIWISRSDQFNDPFDSQFIINGVHVNNQDITFAASFSEKYDDICLWSHYANYHKGFCLEYAYKDFEDSKITVLPIYYSKDIDVNIDGMQASFVKYIVWENELEWRYTDQSQEALENKDNPGYLKAFINPCAIYLGSRCSDPILISEIMKAAKKIGIPIYRMALDKRKNSLVRKMLIQN